MPICGVIRYHRTGWHKQEKRLICTMPQYHKDRHWFVPDRRPTLTTTCQHTNTSLVYPNPMEFGHTNEKCNDCKRIVAVNTGAAKVVGR